MAENMTYFVRMLNFFASSIKMLLMLGPVLAMFKWYSMVCIKLYDWRFWHMQVLHCRHIINNTHIWQQGYETLHLNSHKRCY